MPSGSEVKGVSQSQNDTPANVDFWRLVNDFFSMRLVFMSFATSVGVVSSVNRNNCFSSVKHGVKRARFHCSTTATPLSLAGLMAPAALLPLVEATLISLPFHSPVTHIALPGQPLKTFLVGTFLSDLLPEGLGELWCRQWCRLLSPLWFPTPPRSSYASPSRSLGRFPVASIVLPMLSQSMTTSCSVFPCTFMTGIDNVTRESCTKKHVMPRKVLPRTSTVEMSQKCVAGVLQTVHIILLIQILIVTAPF